MSYKDRLKELGMSNLQKAQLVEDTIIMSRSLKSIGERVDLFSVPPEDRTRPTARKQILVRHRVNQANVIQSWTSFLLLWNTELFSRIITN